MVRLFLASMLLSVVNMPLYAGGVQDELKINLSLSKNKVWQREQVIINLEVISKDELSRLDSSDFKLDGFTVIPLSQESVELNNALHLHHSWQVFSQSAGEQALVFSNIKYRPNSGKAIVLKLPQKTLSVNALPIYIPPSMPVGKIEINNDWKLGWNLFTNRLYQWDIKIIAKQVAPETLPAISRLLRSTEEIQILPFKKNSISQVDSAYEISYQVPFKALSLGRLHLPKVEIQFFDPDSGTIRKALLEQPFVLVLNPFVLILISILLTFFVVLMVWKTFLMFKRRLIRNRKINDALLLLKQAKNYQQIRAALNDYALAKDWKGNFTLEEFSQYLSQDYQQSSQQSNNDTRQIKQLLAQLQNKQFSTNRYDGIGELSRDIYKMLLRFHA